MMTRAQTLYIGQQGTAMCVIEVTDEVVG